MTAYSLTLRGVHLDEIKSALHRPDGEERAAYLLCKIANIGHDPWDRNRQIKYLSCGVIPVIEADIVDASSEHITWLTRSLASILKRAESGGYVVAVVHSHPPGAGQFSVQDDQNEPELIQMVQSRNGPDSRLPSLVLTADGILTGRVWESPKHFVSMRLIRVVGENLRLQYPGRGHNETRREFDRQALAFGKTMNDDLSRLRIGVVGCGGTGSAVAMLLVRLGVGQLLFIDNDIVEHTNLNRLHGARQQDADGMIPKVEVIKRSVAELGLGTRVVAINAWVGDEACKDALRSCDVIFGCTDDHDGRLYLNRFAYFYLTLVFDVGLGMEITDTDPPAFAALDGRVTVLAPGNTCLACRGIVSPARAREEVLKRTNPDAFEREKAERYIIGGNVPNPAVVTFTTEVATMAVNELLHRMQGFRGEEGATTNRVRKFVFMEDVRPDIKPQPGCHICDKKVYWGVGDMEPYLDRVG